ncbi:TPR repeat protein [Pelomonas saccharophila]|uniref:TPR repeat protein n=1 Tax=Roseateles saccharophilus TaxID=304 RepID=A0ABU1YG53_ROSSA|nr:tetratricopeptide repeat protein [Roseateles saccharophilus]MDR7267803.1 TPR repeat protein [Roseateles saccharophilus]
MKKRSSEFLNAMAAYDADDETLALALMEQCAKSGDPSACFLAALWYRDGVGAPASPDRSAHWLTRFQELAENGDVEAQWQLGQHFRFGNLLPLDIARANYWLERAAEGGHGEAQHHLAWFYERGQYGYPVDKEAAESWYQSAFKLENPETIYLFALRQFNDGRPTDSALELLRKAGDLGFGQANDVLQSITH